MNRSEIRVCRNKNCQRELPLGYKHRVCEACRNQQVQKAKAALNGIGAGVVAVGIVAVYLLTNGKIDLHK